MIWPVNTKNNEKKIEIKKADKPLKPATSSYQTFESNIKNLTGTTIQKGKYNKGLGNLNTDLKEYCEKTYKNNDGVPTRNNKGFFALNTKYTTLPILLCMVAAGWGFVFGSSKELRCTFSRANDELFWRRALCSVAWRQYPWRQHLHRRLHLRHRRAQFPTNRGVVGPRYFSVPRVPDCRRKNYPVPCGGI